ncbi:Bestrophin, RFP-TM, chloride channel-domain-containing protein [Glomus cerebriforme]|uniref:Bestrophin, RFP-TM, chloride channel-domain-containing protein n=1 Tax=Glomus cerebriforme TaxID=658196 RepID=A0A397SWQ3_9GLOM|nr:Bestrophin, RFP-TM, chloride channel-domain-containing protein [Glomus cerebriforme]
MPKKHSSVPKLYNPYSYHRPHLIRWRGSVIPKVLPSTIVVTLVSVIVCIVNLEAKIKLSIPSTFIPVLGFVVGLLLTYRTNTAYDRYWEGRRLWSTMVVAIRNLTRNIWVNVKENDGTSDLVEKITAINLLLGFAVATKHYLREEDGILYEDLKPLISNIKSDLPGFEPLEEQNSSSEVNHNLPLEITLYLSSYIDNKRQNNKADVPTTNSMYGALNTLIDCLTQFERILRSPIPLAYSIHLSQTVWIYCLSLPFQLVDGLKYITIPIVFLATFILMGILQIGGEIENPFGYDENDLDLDGFCDTIKHELNTITARQKPKVDDWVYNSDNHPFGKEEITASEARKLSIDEVRTLLTKEGERTSIENNNNFREVIIEEKDENENENLDVTVKMN